MTDGDTNDDDDGGDADDGDTSSGGGCAYSNGVVENFNGKVAASPACRDEAIKSSFLIAALFHAIFIFYIFYLHKYVFPALHFISEHSHAALEQ